MTSNFKLLYNKGVIMKTYEKYLISEVDGSKDLCAHCHKKPTADGRSVCSKCAKELDAFAKSREKKVKE